MPSKHRHPAMLVRPPSDIRETAKTVLAEHGWTMQEFVTACMTEVGRDPDRLLALLAESKPAPARKGRPPRSPEAGESS